MVIDNGFELHERKRRNFPPAMMDQPKHIIIASINVAPAFDGAPKREASHVPFREAACIVTPAWDDAVHSMRGVNRHFCEFRESSV